MLENDLNLVLTVIGSFLFGFLISLIVLRGWAVKASRANLDKEKTAFIAIASHYLLTPLSILEGTISHLQEKESTLSLEEREEQHQIIKESSDRLLRIAEEMLLVMRLKDGKLPLNVMINSLLDITSNVVRKEDRNAKRRGILVRFIANSTNKLEGLFDADSLRTAIGSVIDNAIKFSHDSSEVTVLLEEREQVYILEVRDQGIGMTAEQMQLAKDKFYRGTSPYQFDYEGIGLGLHVTDLIMKAHNGQLLIQSSGKDGLGTVVQLIFPRQ